MKNNLMLAIIIVVVGAGAGFAYLKFGKSTPSSPAPATPGPGAANIHVPGHETTGEWCAGHQIAEADCPWCKPSLIESKGFCKGLDVAEALCSVCSPALIAGFKAEKDWGAGHNIPESQCAECKAGNLPPDERGPK